MHRRTPAVRTVTPRGVRVLATGMSALVLLALHITSPDAAFPQEPTTTPKRYLNPVSAGVVDALADPTVIRSPDDGLWYAVGTTNPVRAVAGDATFHQLPILRSADLVNWTYVGAAFADGGTPSWWPQDARAWAPDIHYLNGHFQLTYALSSGGIGYATATSAAGPWADGGQLVPASGGGCSTSAIDPALFSDTDGTHYLYWGSYGSICVAAVNSTATAVTGPVTVVSRGALVEAADVVRHDGYYYLFTSNGSCCAGADSGYSVTAGRSRSPLGPFLDQAGNDLTNLAQDAGHVLVANGNRWVGGGHTAVATDLAGQDWLVYHAVDRNDPGFAASTGSSAAELTRRPLLIDRLDWIDGWPTVRAGAGASDTAQTAPVTGSIVDGTFTSSLAGWTNGGTGAAWRRVVDENGAHVERTGAATTGSGDLTSTTTLHGNVRVQGRVRLDGGTGGSAGLLLRAAEGLEVSATVDRSRRRLVLQVGAGRNPQVVSAPLPANFSWTSWQTLTLASGPDGLQASVSGDGVGEPAAEIALPTTVLTGRDLTAGFTARGADAAADSLTVAPAAVPVTSSVPTPVPGTALPEASGGLRNGPLPGTTGSPWAWTRGQVAGLSSSADGLRWPTVADTPGPAGTPAIVRAAPADDAVVQVRVRVQPTDPRQRAGLVLIDDAGQVALLRTARENWSGDLVQLASFGQWVSDPEHSGETFASASTGDTWLRMEYHRDEASGNYLVREAVSSDGTTWDWGGSWTLPVQGQLKVGLLAAGPRGATAVFSDFAAYSAAG